MKGCAGARRNGHWRLLLGSFVLLMGSTAMLLGQAAQGTILGTLRDDSGASIPGATVTVTSLETNIARQAISDDAGSYRVPNLPIGPYRVSAELPGFRRQTVERVNLSIAENLRVDMQLQVGEITQEITVSGTIDTVRTESAEVAYHVREKALVDLPLNGRNYLTLAHLVPGATAGLPDRRVARDGATLTVVGGRAEANNFIIDGISNNEERSGGFIIAPSVDAIQEFKVQTSQFSAEYGRAGGAVVNVSIKSGSNDLHGAVYEFHRNQALDARKFFDRDVLPYIRNQFGAAVGGPVWKDHSFFFFNFEGFRVRESITRFGNVPETAWTDGNFAGAPFTLYDPVTAKPDPANPKAIIRDPFPGNVIPQQRIDPVGSRIAKSYAAPNFRETGNPFNFISANSRPFDQNQVNFRLDHRVSEADSLFGRVSWVNTERTDLGLGAFPKSDGATFSNTGVQIALSETHIFSPTWLNEFRVGYAFLSTKNIHLDQGSDLGRQLGIPGLNPTPFESGYPSIGIRNLAGTDHPVGFGLGLPTEERDQTIQIIDTISLKAGAHGLKFGGDIQRLHFNVATGQVGGASIGFDGRYTRRAGTGTAAIGLGDVLLGLPNSMSRSQVFDLGRFRYWNVHFFVQDDWQIHPNVTLNLGLRYELQTPAQEIRGREALVDVRNCLSGKCDGSGAVLLHRKSLPVLEKDIGLKVENLPWPVQIDDRDSFYSADTNNFAPRIGLAWRPFGDNSTAVRVGAGIFYIEPLAGGTANSGLNVPFQFRNTITGDPVTPDVFLRNGFSNELGGALLRPGCQCLIPQDWKVGYYSKWSLGIERQLSRTLLFETTYVGHTAPNLYVNYRDNRPTPGPGNVQARRPFPNYSGLSSFSPIATSTYHGWLNMLRITGMRGLTSQFSYTFSKTIDNQSAFGGAGDGKAGLVPWIDVPGLGIKAEKARASFDAAHRFTMAYMFAVPTLQDWQAPLRFLLGGWEVTGALTLQTGFPFTVQYALDSANVGDTASFRPNRVGEGNLPVDQRTPQRWFDTAAFAIPAPFTFGNAGRNIIAQDGFQNIDFGLIKNFPLGYAESHSLQFRAEFFNLFNHVNFGLPELRVERTGFGVITSAADARQIQFGLKYIF